MKFPSLLKNVYFWYVIAMALVACLFAYTPQIMIWFSDAVRTSTQTSFFIAGYRLLFPLAAILAGWRFGIKVGFIVCAAAGLIILSGVFINYRLPSLILDVGDIALGTVLCWLVGRQGELKQRLIETADELGKSSSKLTLEVAERKRAEEQYELIANYTADIIYKMAIKEEKFNYVSPSAERILGYNQSEALSIKLVDLMTPESYRKQNIELISAIQNHLNSAIFQSELKHKDGHVIPFEVHANLVFDERGRPAEIVGVARDITDRKKMEEQLIAQDRLASIGQLTSGMAHELNNPLTSIINFSSILLKKDLDEDTLQDIKAINEEAQRIAGTIKNLLSFSRKQPQEKQATNINESIRKVLDMRKYEQEVNNIKTIVHFEPQLPLVTANGAQLEQVFFNLIINAEFFMIEAHKEGLLVITTRKDGDVVRTTFTDNGPGITAENQKRVFSPLFTTRGDGKGTGLSLSICHGIIIEHGGKMYMREGEDSGATFVIELPVNKK
jgi:PAS domain S-box-containing protein